MGVPEELRQCAIQMVEAEHMQFATPGPGTIRQPNDARQEAEDSDVSDELKEEADEPNCHNCSAAQPDAQDENPQEETVLGIDQTAGPEVVQSFAAVKLQTDLLQEHIRKKRCAASSFIRHGSQHRPSCETRRSWPHHA